MAQPTPRAPLARAIRARAVPVILNRGAHATRIPIARALRAILQVHALRGVNEAPKRTVADLRHLLVRKRHRREREAFFRLSARVLQELARYCGTPT